MCRYIVISFVRHFAGRVCDDYQGNDATCCDRHPRRTGRYLHNSNAERASIGKDARQCDAQQGIIIPSYLLHEGMLFARIERDPFKR